jgi:thermostable 8-oxoguanine DNA glycosylase
MQTGWVINESRSFYITLPDETTEVIPGVYWGAIDAFPSPAYWKYQVLARQHQGIQIQYRLGHSLTEEVAACVLGGHGIPSSVGLAAFRHLQAQGAFVGSPPNEATLLAWLSEPIDCGVRKVRYRFARQKSKFLALALQRIWAKTPPTDSGIRLRDWLIESPGIGYKTASWIARNWLDADDVAILDIHVLRAGQLGGFFKPGLTVERHYREIENQFVQLSIGMGVRASELDAVIWYEMMSSPQAVRRTIGSLAETSRKPQSTQLGGRPRTKQRDSNANQLALLI